MQSIGCSNFENRWLTYFEFWQLKKLRLIPGRWTGGETATFQKWKPFGPALTVAAITWKNCVNLISIEVWINMVHDQHENTPRIKPRGQLLGKRNCMDPPCSWKLSPWMPQSPPSFLKLISLTKRVHTWTFSTPSVAYSTASIKSPWTISYMSRTYEPELEPELTSKPAFHRQVTHFGPWALHQVPPQPAHLLFTEQVVSFAMSAQVPQVSFCRA